MEYQKIEQLENWFKKYEDSEPELKFEDYKVHECKQASVILFLASKLKNKKERWFLHGEHDTIYIGENFDSFEDFSENDVKIAVAHDIFISDIDGGFQINASM